MTDWRPMQTRLRVSPDNAPGRATLAALMVTMKAKPAMATSLALGAAVHLPAYGIMDSPLRLAHFMAQAGHESDGFNAMTEYASGRAYEGRLDLGNTQPGDGPRFRGRGVFQITGRANYRSIGQALGIDLEGNPEVAAIPSIGMLTACRYWQTRGLNQLADADDLMAITRRINGGLNGYEDRKSRLTQAKGLILP